jgi:KNTase C-terminal domain
VFFHELRRVVFDHTESQIHDAIREVIVGELYEGLGKIRNSLSSETHESLPRVTMRIALLAELMLGLVHRHIYTTAWLTAVESMTLTPRPSGHDELCRLAMKGTLTDAQRTARVIEEYWASVIDWTAVQDIDLAPVNRHSDRLRETEGSPHRIVLKYARETNEAPGIEADQSRTFRNARTIDFDDAVVFQR